MTRVYVYYRVDRAHLAACADAVLAAQAALRRALPGVHAELLHRPEPDAEGRWTLMEVYDGLALPSDVPTVAAAAAPWSKGLRHVETFVSMDDRDDGRTD